MLKISKNQIVSGQPVVVNLQKNGKEKWSDIEFAKSAFTRAGIKTGDIINIDKVTGGVVQCTHNSKTYQFYWSQFKQVTEIPKESENLGSGNVEYVIFYDRKKYKTKKYKDMGTVKAALLVMMDYHDKFYQLSRNYLDNCPEHKYLNVPEWLGGDNISRKQFQNVEIFEWSNRKLGNKVDFDILKFYDDQMMLIKISSQFGSSARELYKKVSDTHKYMFVFMHEDYKNQYCDYESLKESDIIKGCMKDLKFKNTFKVTKNGKTSIAFDNATDVIKLSNYLPKDSKYFIIDMKGDQLVRKEESLVVQEMRDEKLEALFA